ncbi:hypothetical protein [Borrelia duttonii]|uniref:Lipoprotein n=1 Tax=Borrelia duttonii (strain Ly) TaxID=412419 RepID=B5RNJ6_BORDL|nr:hypothetical protein BDU_1141 [Borrelia duttonii Ly]
MRIIIKNVILICLFVIFGCSHNLFIKPKSGLVKDYASVMVGDKKYYYMEEFPINFDLVFKFVDNEHKSTSNSYSRPLPGGFEERSHFSSTSLEKSQSSHLGKISVLVNSKDVERLSIKSLKELNEYLKKDDLGSLDIKFAFVIDLTKSLLKKSLVGNELFMFDYKGLVAFKDSIKNTNTTTSNDNLSVTVHYAYKGLKDSIHKIYSRTYNQYDSSLKKFTDKDKHKDGNEFYFEVKGNIGSFSNLLDNAVQKIKTGLQ